MPAAMTTVYHEQLAESYLLLLTPGKPVEPEHALDYSLSCACQSGKPAVWVDCELVMTLSDQAARTLVAYHHKLQAQHQEMVLVHASEKIKEELLNRRQLPGLCFVPSLIEAAWQSGLR